MWVRPGEEGMPGGPGDAFYCLLVLVPVLVVFAVLNSIALTAIVRRPRTLGRRLALALWLAVAVLWVGAVVMGHLYSVRQIDARYG